MKQETALIIARALFCLSLGMSIGRIVTEHRYKTEAPRVDTVYVVSAPVDTLSDWQALQMAIILTESRCNPNATGKTQDAGLYQLTPIYVQEANRVAGTNYAHSDAYDPVKSMRMFAAVQDYYNPEHDQNRAIKLHNPGGASIGYPQKVKQNLELVKRIEKVRYELRKCDEEFARGERSL